MIYGKDGGETLMGADQCMESVRHQGGEKWERTVKGAVFSSHALEKVGMGEEK